MGISWWTQPNLSKWLLRLAFLQSWAYPGHLPVRSRLVSGKLPEGFRHVVQVAGLADQGSLFNTLPGTLS